MKVKWKQLCASALAVTMIMGNLAYGSPLTSEKIPEKTVSEKGRDQEAMQKEGLVMHSTFDEDSARGNRISDVTGNGNNGTVMGKPVFGKSIRGCMIDEPRVYKKALDEYEEEGSPVIADKMADQLAKITPDGEYPQNRIDAMAEEIHNTRSAPEGMTTAAAMTEVKVLQEKYDQFLKGDKPLASFQVIADVHVKSGGSTQANAANLILGLKDIKAMNPNTLGIMNLGDFTQNGTANQYNVVYDIMDQYSPVPDDKIIITLGNHDVRGPDSADWNKDESVISKYWPTAKAIYLEKNARYMPDTGGKVYFERWLGAYHFIVLNTENGLKDAMYLSDEQLEWLDKTLAENASPDKPIFVMGHNALKDTHWRSNILNDFGNQDGKVKAIFAKYPQVIYMSGHIHNGFGVAEAIDRGFGTMLDIPSYNESENGVTDKGVGYHVTIYDDRVVFKARNFKTSTWMPEYDITVTTPNLPTVYQEAAKLNPDDYSAESYRKLADLMKEAQSLFAMQYDQSDITYEKTDPPAKSLFTKETRARINELTLEMKKAINDLESSEKL